LSESFDAIVSIHFWTFVMAPQVLQYTLTPIDLFRSVFPMIGRRRIWFRRIVGVLLAAFALNIFLQYGLGWQPIVVSVVAVQMLSPYGIAFLVASGLVLWFRPRIRITFDSNEIGLATRKREMERIPWTSFNVYGSAIETEQEFHLDCGRGHVYVPKRAFADAQELTGFRALVREKLGDRFSAMIT
jgi:hypothetical protein